MEITIDSKTFTHILAGLVFLSRLADIVSTRLVTPNLRLEANPIARRLGWRFAYATLLLAATPYFSREVAVCVLTTSFLVAGSNLFRGWVARALGEEELAVLTQRIALRGNRTVSLLFVLGSAALNAFVGVLLMCFSRGETDTGFWFGMGIVLYGATIAIYGSISVLKVFRKMKSP